MYSVPPSNPSDPWSPQAQNGDRSQSGQFNHEPNWPNFSQSTFESRPQGFDRPPQNVAQFPPRNLRGTGPRPLRREGDNSMVRGRQKRHLRSVQPKKDVNRLEEIRRLRAIATEKSTVLPPNKELLEKSKQPSPKVRPRPQNGTVKRRKTQPISPLLYATRMLILGVGLAVISGTGLSILSSQQKAEVLASQTTENSVAETEKASNSRYVVPLYLRQSRELTELKSQLQNLAASSPELMPGIFLVDLDTGGYIDINAGVAFPAASTIKLPVLVAFFQAFDEGKVRLDETLTMEASQVAEGSGEMQYQKPGTKYTVLETITKMIVISDNTATNMIIDRLGGAEVLNQQFLKWGLRNTAIRNPLPDLEGTNTTSPHDLTNLVSQVEQGGLLSMKSRDRLFHIMEETENDSLIPKGLGRGAIIAHKTGNINSVLADAGAIDMPNGKRYLLSVIVKRPTEGYTPAANLIRDVSETVYKYFE